MSDLPRRWKTLVIKDVLKALPNGKLVGQGWSPLCDKEPARESEWGVLKTTAIQAGKFEPEYNKRLPANFSPKPNLEVHEGDLLITCAGPRSRCGVPCLIRSTREKLMMSGKMYRFRPDESRIDPFFLEYFLLSPRAQRDIDGMKTGISESGLNLTHARFFELKVPLPSLSEQRYIRDVLEEQFSRLDAALASVRTVREKSKPFRRSLLQSAFHGALAGDSEVSIPPDWSLLSLDEVSEVRLGRQRSPRNHSGLQMRPYLRAANVTWQGLDFNDVKEMNFSDEELEVFSLKSGDILVSEASGSPNEVGKAAVFQGQIENCCFQNTLLRVRPLSIDTRYLHYFLTGTAMSGAYARESRGVGISHLGRTKLASWLVPVAPAAEQRRIVSVLDEQFSRLDEALIVTNQLEARIASQRRSLLHAAFTGTLTTQWRETNNG